SISALGRSTVQWFNKEKLPADYQKAAENYIANGAVKALGEIQKVEILHRNDGSSPVHKSSFNRADKAEIVSARIHPVKGDPRTHHIYRDGTGTIKKGDKREYSTSSR
ncbi:hypothetical protein DOTSEDRAFT_134489, partial [Dothistroma septosporum NZE10]